MKTLRTAAFCTLLAALAGCCPCRRGAVSQSDSIRIETVVRTEYVRDTVYVDMPSEATSQTVMADSSHLETSLAVSDARVGTDGRLHHSLHNKAYRLPFEVQTRVEHRDSIVYIDKVITKTENVLTRSQQRQIHGFWISLAMNILFLGMAAIRIWGALKK